MQLGRSKLANTWKDGEMTDYAELVEQISDEADLCRNDGADDIAVLLDKAKAAITDLTQRLAEAEGALREIRDFPYGGFIASGRMQGGAKKHLGKGKA